MEFKNHDNLKGLHSFLSPSKYHWIFYDEEKLVSTFNKSLAVERGTKLHEFASMCIQLGQKLPKSNKTLNMYVNDAIGYHMISEQPLYYSENSFGTADAISFRKDILRIHDLKTGESPASIHQLEIYNALFCLEYRIKPEDIHTELRIYQLDEVLTEEPDPKDISAIMDKIVNFDKLISKIRNES